MNLTISGDFMTAVLKLNTISDDGVFISEKLAELLGVKAGDDIEISVSDTKKPRFI